jgi:uncharacterized membrane protein YeaQ/YmgE (transglycosylase-associated protein family)
MQFIWFILVGLIAGWLAGKLMKGGGFGVIGDIVVGILGALVGGFIFGSLGVSGGGGLLGSIAVATVGAVILIFVVRLFKKKGKSA